MYHDHIETWLEEHISQHNWLFLGEKFLLFKPHFAQLQAMKTSETYTTYAPPVGEPKMNKKLLECAHIFALSWKLNLTK